MMKRRLFLLGVGLAFLFACKEEPPTTKLPVGTPARSIVHAMGTAEVPLSPKRVVVLDTAPLDSAIALGVIPVGAEFHLTRPQYLGDRLQGIDSVGLNNNPNLETIINLQPDLILGTKIGTEQLYNNLTKIAPTILTEGSGRSGEWKENFRLHAEALGLSTQGRELLAKYDRRIATLRQKISKITPIPIVSVVATGGGRLGAYTVRSFSGSILAELGLRRPEIQTKRDRWAIEVSRESLASIDGDLLFLIESAAIKDALKLQQFTDDKMFAQLSAVKQQRTIAVDNEVWIAGRSIIAANRVLDDISKAIDRIAAN
jgi:iron complex transport system substrate-binding protein